VIHLEPFMMRGLENIDGASIRVVRGDDESRHALAEQFLPQDSLESLTQALRAVFRGDDLAYSPHAAAERVAAACQQAITPPRHVARVDIAEDFRTIIPVEGENVRRGETQAQPHGDDASRRGASDKIEVVYDSLAGHLLDASQEADG
jgi:hypothetical protein